jgi:Ca2+-binding RTX toxin-like protein
MGVLVNFLNGTSGRDKIDLYGRQIGYQVDAREGDDIVRGTDQMDFLFGGDGADIIHGQGANDLIGGGRGADTLYGGGGGDRFLFRPEDVVQTVVNAGPFSFVVESFETDRIVDFDLGGAPGAAQDVLDIDDLLDGKTSFSGATAAQAIAQGYLYWVQTGAPGQPGFGTTIYIDRNGAAADSFSQPDLAIAHLDGVAANQLGSAHFSVLPW